MTAPEAGPYTPLSCPMRDCDEELYLSWELSVGLLRRDLTDPSPPPAPADAWVGQWHVECLAGHRPLVPAPIECPCGRNECTEECNDADVDATEELRTFRASDLARLRELMGGDR
ncbi:hypothetical protein E1211_15315 [Micromonospora sp. 15K316]|uniref:hypothetical protein n=1 Tax=Micromonospora sp. 15K316 TaxID=2530376 RepID=UPI0010510FDF|nr:hypothetical protein [Micromonospora sp. 15K316]TDC35673.1 hypothetical protein E1211_15315 [Micromonospora sp. 15K316]